MHPLLKSARRKLEWANQGRKSLIEQIDSYGNSQLKFVEKEIDPNTDADVYRLTKPLLEPPSKIQSTIGDVLFNYRASLDHLMSALIRISGNDPSPQTQFPIYENPTSQDNPWRGESKLKGAKNVIKEIIEAQHMAYPLAREFLWELHRLNNIDKHIDSLSIAGYYAGTFHKSGKEDLLVWRMIQDDLMLNVGPIEPGTVLAQIPREHAHRTFVPSFELAFGDNCEKFKGDDVRGTIGGISDVVTDIHDQFEALFFDNDRSRLGRLYLAFKDSFPLESGDIIDGGR